MTQVAIIGAGSFGTALACAARRAGLDVALWAREPEVAAAIDAGHGNPLFLPELPLEPGIRAGTDLAACLAGAEFVLLAVPAQFLRGVATGMRASLRAGVPVISCSKGIEQGSCALMPEVIAETLPDAPVGVLAGPSFAREVVLGMPTGVTLASRDATWSDRVAGLLGSARFQVYTSPDPVAATVGGAYKNVLAIATGIALARKMGDNARGLLIARGLYEMACLARAKGGNPVHLIGLAGAGDVTLTCMGTQSRNTTFGIALGEGQSPAAILAARKVVTEGVHTAKSMSELGRRLDLQLPIVAAVNHLVNEGGAIEETIAELLAHPPGPELAALL
ncbi:MAG: glycerol-3-phosphate acyltransferase [Bradyrhizobiaceae bacterium]|nr:MAG: glycerol-3-phosphate acyltransferase [Bradyrhizobiaceae bacterium]